MTGVPHKRRRERNRYQAQPSSGLLQPCRLISVVQVASIPVSGARLFFLPPFRPASTHRTGLSQAKAPLAHGRRARPFHSRLDWLGKRGAVLGVFDQLLDAANTFSCGNTGLGKLAAQGIDSGLILLDEQIARLRQRQRRQPFRSSWSLRSSYLTPIPSAPLPPAGQNK